MEYWSNGVTESWSREAVNRKKVPGSAALSLHQSNTPSLHCSTTPTLDKPPGRTLHREQHHLDASFPERAQGAETDCLGASDRRCVERLVGDIGTHLIRIVREGDPPQIPSQRRPAEASVKVGLLADEQIHTDPVVHA